MIKTLNFYYGLEKQTKLTFLLKTKCNITKAEKEIHVNQSEFSFEVLNQGNSLFEVPYYI